MKYKIFTIGSLSLIFLMSTSCTKEAQAPGEDETLYPELKAEYSRFDPVENITFSLVNDTLISKPLVEISGLVSGRKNPSLLYMHEDSGNPNKLSVYDTLGQFVGDIVLMNTLNRDWEDIAIGPGPEEGEVYIYIADFGDNRARREEVLIHRILEPAIDLASANLPFQILVQKEDIATITYTYPDGPRDAETLLLDPSNKDLIVITKREAGVHVYQLPYPQSTSEVAAIHFRGRLPFRSIVGGDVAKEGNQILIKDYGSVYYWSQLQGSLVETIFGQVPEQVTYVAEFQGESIGFSYGSNGYFTISETENNPSFDPILYHYRR